jgi:uncharacterized phage protein (TIGR02220 family)
MSRIKKIPFDIESFFQSFDVQMMNMTETGVYITLLLKSCQSKDAGYLPDDDTVLRRMCKMSMDEWERVKSVVMKKFEKDEFGRYYNERMLSEISKKIDAITKQSEAGKRGGGNPKLQKKATKSKDTFKGRYKGMPPPIYKDTFGQNTNNPNGNTDNTENVSFIVENAEDQQIREVIEYLNEKAGTNYKVNSQTTSGYIKARLSEGFKVDDFKTIIDKKCFLWLNDPKMVKFLRPETLFCQKHFESYLNEKILPYKSDRTIKYERATNEASEFIRANPDLFGGIESAGT